MSASESCKTADLKHALSAFASAHAGHWRGLPVAVKTVVFSAGTAQADMYEHIVTEVAVCMSVSHPNVVITYK